MTGDEIAEFIRSFEDCSWPRARWTHHQHLVMALWYLLHHGRDEATRLIRDGIQRYNLAHGNRTGYHETITLAWIAVIEQFLAVRGRQSPAAVLAAELLHTCGRPDFLFRYYSRDRLLSSEARHQWVEPDLRLLEDPNDAD
jgi:hypothetical protein